MRCPYCHNSELVLEPPADMKIPEEEVLAHLKKRSNVLSGLCITGGEPTLQPDLRDFIVKVRALGYKIKLDTNGLKPDTLRSLLDEGLLDYVAMDIKAGRDNYKNVTGVSDTAAVSESADILLRSGIEFEFRTTVVTGLHTKEDFNDIRTWMDEIRGDRKIPRYFLQSYVERDTVMDRDRDMGSFSGEELEAFAEILRSVAVNVALRGVD